MAELLPQKAPALSTHHTCKEGLREPERTVGPTHPNLITGKPDMWIYLTVCATKSITPGLCRAALGGRNFLQDLDGDLFVAALDADDHLILIANGHLEL